jgi:hypothetical protein
MRNLSRAIRRNWRKRVPQQLSVTLVVVSSQFIRYEIASQSPDSLLLVNLNVLLIHVGEHDT